MDCYCKKWKIILLWIICIECVFCNNFYNKSAVLDVLPNQAVGATVHFNITHNGSFSDINFKWSFAVGSGDTISQLKVYKNGSTWNSSSERSELVWSITNFTHREIKMQLKLKNLVQRDSESMKVTCIVFKGGKPLSACGDFQYQPLNVAYCPSIQNSNRTKSLNIIGGIDAEFSDNVTYSCENEAAIIVEETIHDHSINYVRTCQDIAQWDGTYNVSCAYAPDPVIFINSTSNNPVYYGGDNIILKCENPGNPPATDVDFYVTYWNGTMGNISPVLHLEPTHNGVNLSCMAANAYTEKFPPFGGISSHSVPIRVLYAPEALDPVTPDVYVSVGDSIIVEFNFSANPLIYKEDITLQVSGDNDKTQIIPNEEIELFNRSSLTYKIQQSCTYNIDNVTDESFGQYTLSAYSSDPKLKVLPLHMKLFLKNNATRITTTDFPDTSTGSLPWAAIIGGSVAGFLIISIIVAYSLFRLKRNNKSTNDKIKEERDNPLYGTSTGPVAYSVVVKNKKNSKEERINPLYDSNGTNTVEEAYATVDTRNKKKRIEGNENATFSDENPAVVYAAVNKPNKMKTDVSVEAVYTEVNKKKK